VVILPPAVRGCGGLRPVDLRRGFDGLAALTREVLRCDPLSGHLFVFWNRRRDRVKILFWDRSGYVLWCKRLERGRFHFPEGGDATGGEVEAAELMLLLEGIELAGSGRRARWVPACAGPRAGRPERAVAVG